MTKIDVFSGFLGAGKTTLIKKMISESYKGQKLVLIENEFGEIGIDGGFLQDAGINITEMNSGCICCSLVGDFGKALNQVIEQYHPDRVLIEPSGVGKLSDVIGAVNKVTNNEVTLGYTVAVADAGKVKIYMKNFGEFYNNQIETASTIILSRTDSIPQAKLEQDAGINITEMNSGCICCSLVGDFGKALNQVIEQYHPDRVLIEPSGVGKLSDVIGAVNKVTNNEVTLGYTVAVADAGKVKIYMKNFGEFYNNQIETASTIILSRTDSIPQAKLDTAVDMLRQHNQVATIVTTPWGELTGEQLLSAMEGKASLAAELARMEQERLEEDEHHHEHHHHDENCTCGCHDHELLSAMEGKASLAAELARMEQERLEEDEHHHEHHHHDENCTCGCHDHEHEHEHEHHHEHHHDENCACGCHDHEHEHADAMTMSTSIIMTRTAPVAAMITIITMPMRSLLPGAWRRPRSLTRPLWRKLCTSWTPASMA